MNRALVPTAVAMLFAPACPAQWDPANGQWGKSDAADLRLMTWNVQDGICSLNDKSEAYTDWCALARIVAAMKPDVLILQECGDNEGQGVGGGVDSVSKLTSVVKLFLRGGTDSYTGGGPVTSYVQKYAAAFDMPHVMVSGQTDGYNRNIVLSRYPFKDLNGDGDAYLDDIPFITKDLYSPGGDGQSRGFAWAEIDLPDEVYEGDLVVGNGHLKSGSETADRAERLKAGQNIAYFIDYMLNGAGTGSPDPRDKIADSPKITKVLGETTLAVWGGDFNEDEATNGRRGPAEWMTRAEFDAGSDGTDRDRGDAEYDDARDVFSGSRYTVSSAKFDYLCWQDSVAGLRRSWVFATGGLSAAQLPPEIKGYPGGDKTTSSKASDHKPVIADLILPLAHRDPPGPFGLASPADGAVTVDVEPTLEWTPSPAAETYEVTVALDEAFGRIVLEQTGIVGTAFAVPGDALFTCGRYYWGVEAVNRFGRTPSTPASFRFDTLITADCNRDGRLNINDFICFQAKWKARDPYGDFNQDGQFTINDYIVYQSAFAHGCE